MSWKKVKGLFWQSEQSEPSVRPPGADASGEMSDDDFAALLAGSPHAVPPGPHDEVADLMPVQVQVQAQGDGVAIDFQAQYDAAGIPDTDEVEQLENFLSRLDPSLPQVSKLAAAQAFLGAIGKDKTAVLQDAERKIMRVRAILLAQEQDTRSFLEQEQEAINQLQAQIEAHRTKMQQVNGQLEGVRHACLQEESRLQASRVFFGTMDPVSPGAPAAPGKQ